MVLTLAEGWQVTLLLREDMVQTWCPLHAIVELMACNGPAVFVFAAAQWFVIQMRALAAASMHVMIVLLTTLDHLAPSLVLHRVFEDALGCNLARSRVV